MTHKVFIFPLFKVVVDEEEVNADTPDIRILLLGQMFEESGVDMGLHKLSNLWSHSVLKFQRRVCGKPLRRIPTSHGHHQYIDPSRFQVYPEL